MKVVIFSNHKYLANKVIKKKKDVKKQGKIRNHIKQKRDLIFNRIAKPCSKLSQQVGKSGKSRTHDE